MFLVMYGASRTGSLGRTRNCCSAAGHSAPSRIADRISTTVPTPGSNQVLRTTLAKNRPAHSTAMTARISLLGRTALSPV